MAGPFSEPWAVLLCTATSFQKGHFLGAWGADVAGENGNKDPRPKKNELSTRLAGSLAFLNRTFGLKQGLL